MAPVDRKYPALPDAAQELAARAEKHGMSLTYYSSGAIHPDSGYKLWYGKVSDHFADREFAKPRRRPVCSARTLHPLKLFMDGYEAASSSVRRL